MRLFTPILGVESVGEGGIGRNMLIGWLILLWEMVRDVSKKRSSKD